MSDEKRMFFRSSDPVSDKGAVNPSLMNWLSESCGESVSTWLPQASFNSSLSPLASDRFILTKASLHKIFGKGTFSFSGCTSLKVPDKLFFEVYRMTL